MDTHEISNLKKFQLIAAIICTIIAIPILGGYINSTLYSFLSIAALVLSVMIVIKPRDEDLTKIPPVITIIACVLEIASFVFGKFYQGALLDFVADFTIPVDLTAGYIFTPSQIDSLGIVMVIGGISLISWVLIAVAAITYFINYSRLKKKLSI